MLDLTANPELHTQLDQLDQHTMSVRYGLYGKLENKFFVITIDGYTDYGRTMNIYRKFWKFKVLVFAL